MQIATNFFADPAGGPITGKAFSRLLRLLGVESLEFFLSRYSNTVLSCGAVEITTGTAGAEVAATDVVAIVDRLVVVEERIACAIEPGQSMAYLTAKPQTEFLDEERKGGPQVRWSSGLLTTEPTAIPFARWKWELSTDQATRQIAVLDSHWWPRAERIVDHPHSRAACSHLADWLDDAPPEVAFLLAAARRGEHVSWLQLIPGLLTLAAGRLQGLPGQLAEVATLAVCADQAEIVSGLQRLLRADSLGHLPPMLEIDQHRHRLLQVLRSAHPTQRFDGEGIAVTLDCGIAPQNGWLAASIYDATGGIYRIDAQLHGTQHSAFRAAGRGAEPLLPIRCGTPVVVTVSSQTSIPSAVGIGLYVAS